MFEATVKEYTGKNACATEESLASCFFANPLGLAQTNWSANGSSHTYRLLPAARTSVWIPKERFCKSHATASQSSGDCVCLPEMLSLRHTPQTAMIAHPPCVPAIPRRPHQAYSPDEQVSALPSVIPSARFRSAGWVRYLLFLGNSCSHRHRLPTQRSARKHR